jgi:site-specific DNA-methyltransferase (adenine-specific)
LVFYKKQPTYNHQKTQGHKPINSGIKKKEVLNKSNIYGKVKKDLKFGGNTDRFPRTNLIFKSDKQTNYLHPTQKPVALFEYLIKTYTNENDLILDNCMGSGTTAVACINTKRNFIGFEKDKNYFDIAEKRIKEHRIEGDGNLFK